VSDLDEDGESFEGSTVRHAKAAAEAAGLDTGQLSLTMEVEAPILRLETQHGAALEIHLGHFSGKSIRELPVGSMLSLSESAAESEAVDLQRFALICQLRDTRIKLIEPGETDRFAYEPSKIVLVAARRPHGGEIHAESTRFRCHIDPGLMRLFGHLQVGLDFALSPLSGGVMGRQIESSPRVVRTASLKRSISRQNQPWKFDLRTGSFDLIWDPKGGGGYHEGSVKGHIAGVNVKVNVDDQGRMTVVGNAQDAAMTCGDRRFFSGWTVRAWTVLW